MPYASGLLAANILGVEQYLETSSPVAFAFPTVEPADSIMDLQHMIDVAESASISVEVPGKSAFMPCKSEGAYLFFIV
jgi:hypothetical protein